MARDFPPGVKLWVTEFNVMYAQVWQGKADGTAHAAAAFLNATQVIPTPSHVLGRISPIFFPFFPVFCAFSPSRRGGSNEPQAGIQGQETTGR